MPDEKSIPRIVVLAGPTCAGKTDAAVRAAGEAGGEIISADSMQVYRYMDIGTAKPDRMQRAAVPHHGLDLVDPDQPFNASLFVEEADRIIDRLHARQVPAFVVGGTGLYIKVLLGGLLEGPGADEALRAQYKKEAALHGKACLHEQLRKKDPLAAAAIDPRDASRVIRALEVFDLTGVSIVERRKAHRFNRQRYACLKIGLAVERETLFERIDRRTDRMMAAGFVDEVKSLLERGYAPELKAMQSLGYRQIVGYLKGLHSLDEAIRLIKRDTRRYAKRQMTWFKADKDIQWVSGGDIDFIRREIREFLGRPEFPASGH